MFVAAFAPSALWSRPFVLSVIDVDAFDSLAARVEMEAPSDTAATLLAWLAGAVVSPEDFFTSSAKLEATLLSITRDWVPVPVIFAMAFPLLFE